MSCFLLLGACSGKVIFDDGSGGAGSTVTGVTSVGKGSVATTTGKSTTIGVTVSTTTGQQPIPCTSDACVGDGDNCDCKGSCLEQAAEAQCQLLPSPVCSCFLNGAFLGQCTQPSGNACDLTDGCCNDLFHGIK